MLSRTQVACSLCYSASASLSPVFLEATAFVSGGGGSRTPLAAEAAALLSGSDILVSADGGVAHLGALLRPGAALVDLAAAAATGVASLPDDAVACSSWGVSLFRVPRGAEQEQQEGGQAPSDGATAAAAADADALVRALVRAAIDAAAALRDASVAPPASCGLPARSGGICAGRPLADAVC